MFAPSYPERVQGAFSQDPESSGPQEVGKHGARPASPLLVLLSWCLGVCPSQKKPESLQHTSSGHSRGRRGPHTV